MTARRIKDYRMICRDASKFKPLRTIKVAEEEMTIPQAQNVHPSVPDGVPASQDHHTCSLAPAKEESELQQNQQHLSEPPNEAPPLWR